MSAILSGGRRRSAWSSLAEVDWSRGIVADAPRDAIPKSGVNDAADFLLHEQGLAQKRGGTGYYGPGLTGVTRAQSVFYAEFPAGGEVVAQGLVGAADHLFNATTGADLGATTVVYSSVGFQPPVLRIGGGKNLVILTSMDGTTKPAKYAGGGAAPAALGGTPPAGRFACVHKTRLVLGNTAANPNRLFFSPTPDIESTWDTANSWIDCDYPITGLASLHNTLLIFSQGHTERIIGSTPPPGTDMDRAPVGTIGCTDARSIVVQEGNAIFANPRGVYLTNGSGFENLTSEGMIESYWQSLFPGYDIRNGWIIAAGVYRSFYFVTIIDNNGVTQATLMCYVPRRAWWRVTNINAAMYAPSFGTQQELYYADRLTNRIYRLSGIFIPTTANKNDANGLPVQPMLEMRMIGEGTGLKAYGDAHLTYDLRDAANDNPTLAAQVAPGIEAPTYAAVPESPLAETLQATRARLSVSKDTQGLSVMLQQTGPSAKTEIYAFEQLIRPYGFASEGQ